MSWRRHLLNGHVVLRIVPSSWARSHASIVKDGHWRDPLCKEDRALVLKPLNKSAVSVVLASAPG